MRILMLPLVLAMSACSLTPPLVKPQAPVAAVFPDAAAPEVATGHAADLGWRTMFGDPRLQHLIALALEHNRDLRLALLAIDKARAQYGVARADRLPTVNASGAGSRARTADDLTTPGRPNTSGQYSATLGFSSYEIDFFGRVQNLNDAALQEFLRVAENRRSVQLSLVAEVMGAWLLLDADARRLRLARDTLATREQALALTRRSHELGATSALALAQAQSSADTARVDAAAFASQVARDRNALALLAGAQVPDALLPASMGATQAPATTATTATALLAVPADLPSSALLQRPDLRAAEHALRGSYANIGAARAAFFPAITLTASVGTASNALSGLFDGGNGTWTFAPQLRLPIFDAGRNQANLRVAEVTRDQSLAQYEKTIQTAFREVADALAERATLSERLAAQASLVQATRRTLELSDARFRLGADNYLTVLDAQRSLYAAQQGEIALQLAEQVNRVTLYKVLGGQWAGG